MAKAIKTNVLRHLDALKIPYETREYTVDDDNFDGKLVAEKVDLPAEMIYKTLVLVGVPHLRGQRGAGIGACQRQRGRARVSGDSGGGRARRLHKSEVRRPVPGLK